MIIQYSHCTKFTPGQLDRDPFSQYESRSVNVRLSEECFEGEAFYRVRIGDRILATGETAEEAIANAQYRLMSESREKAGPLDATPECEAGKSGF